MGSENVFPLEFAISDNFGTENDKSCPDLVSVTLRSYDKNMKLHFRIVKCIVSKLQLSCVITFFLVPIFLF